MICASCGETSLSDDRCNACDSSPWLDGRYRLDSVVGQGAFGLTYRAERVSDAKVVAIKELPFRRIDSMKTKALFQREARVLRQLDHPKIPDFLDDFTAGEGKHLSLYLVQEFIEGTTLEAELRDRRYTEPEVMEIVRELLGVLAYLHSLRPPVIHRDIKPANVMRRSSDGELVLLDFGSVRDAVKNRALGGSTVTGTFGYMAPEQFQGKAEPTTDIYGLGVLAVVLLTRRQPDTMVNLSNRLEWEDFVDVTPRTAEILRSMLRPEMELRAADAERLAEMLGALAESAEVPVEPTSVPEAELTAAALSPRVVEADTAGVDDDPADDPLASDPWAEPEARVGGSPSSLPSSSGDPGSARVAFGVVIALVVIGGLLFAVMAGRVEGPPPAQVARSMAVGETGCEGGPCKPVPRGLKNLTFGMTRAQAQEVIPELADAVDSPGDMVAGELGLGLFPSGGRMPGVQATVETTIGAFPASCTLHFAVRDTLSEMECQLEPFSSLETHTAAERQLLATLEKQYGAKRTPADQETTFGTTRRGDWQWRDAQASLTLRSEFVSFGTIGVKGLPPTSRLELINTSVEHERVEEAVRREATRKAEEERERERREELERLKEQKRRIEATGGSLAEDL